MSYKIEPVEVNDACERPYVVTVNDVTLLDKRGRPRRFKNSITAAWAGSKEATRLRRERLLAGNGEVPRG